MKHGRLLHEVLGWPGPQTGRQLAVWGQWDRDQWNEPDRTDHYLMRIALEVARVLSSKPNEFTLGKFKIPFEWGQSKATLQAAETPAERAAREDRELRWTKAVWAFRLGRTQAAVPQDGGDLDGAGSGSKGGEQ